LLRRCLMNLCQTAATTEPTQHETAYD
jgi:hypothetical protein